MRLNYLQGSIRLLKSTVPKISTVDVALDGSQRPASFPSGRRSHLTKPDLVQARWHCAHRTGYASTTTVADILPEAAGVWRAFVSTFFYFPGKEDVLFEVGPAVHQGRAENGRDALKGATTTVARPIGQALRSLERSRPATRREQDRRDILEVIARARVLAGDRPKDSDADHFVSCAPGTGRWQVGAAVDEAHLSEIGLICIQRRRSAWALGLRRPVPSPRWSPVTSRLDRGIQRRAQESKETTMAWISKRPEYQKVLAGPTSSSARESSHSDLAFPHLQFVPLNDKRRKVIDPLKEEVRRKGLWATHLGPELGGQGYGQLKLALLNEILGRSQWAPIVFGCQAPDTATPRSSPTTAPMSRSSATCDPLLDGEMFSCYSMTEPHCRRRPDAVQDHRRARRRRLGHQRLEVLLLQRQDRVVPDRHGGDQPRRQRLPGHVDVPGARRHTWVNIVRNVGLHGERDDEGSHALIPLRQRAGCRPRRCWRRGQAFVIAQTRLGGGRIHHAMRTIGLSRKALDMMCERALSRETQGSRLSDKQFVQGYIADSYAQLLQFRLMVLYTAWEIDKYNDYKKVRKDIAAVKVVMPTVLHDIAWRAMQVHGALGVTNEMPFMGMVTGRRRDGVGRRSDRGAQGDGGQAGAARLQSHRRHLAHRVDTAQA
jgi:acyl-CoA dehydrogenase